MSPFDEQLRQALKRTEPPADFTARVLAQCAPKEKSGFQGWWRLAAVAAGLLAVTGGVGIQRHHAYELRGQTAKRQLLIAMRITGQQLHSAQARLSEATIQ